jgi:DNA-binding transcriptional ArsR family regulator
MVESSAAPELDRIFRALGDPTRRAILGMVAEREHSVTELARPFEISLAAISKHLKTLEAAGLVERRWIGRAARCRLRPDALMAADAWLAHYRMFWTDRLDALDRFLRERERDTRRKT